jgi:LysM repeat protein
MRRVLRRLAVLVLIASVSPLTDAQPAATASTYVVRAGDTLYRISRATGVSVGELQRLNGLASDRIEVGQTLRLTALAAAPARPSNEMDAAAARMLAAARTTHTVRAGETLFSIATLYGTTVDELRRLNGIVGDNIAAGARLTVPSGTRQGAPVEPAGPVAARLGEDGPPTEPPPIQLGEWRINDTTVPADAVHFVEPGETVYSIAVRYGFASDEITRVNNLSTAPLEPGTLIVLPRTVDPSIPHEVALPPVSENGLALVYDGSMAGRTTASGEAYDPQALTAAHREVPLGAILLVTNTASGRSVFVRVNDRGPLSSSYVVELSAAAAAALELDPDDARRVEIRVVP